MPGPAEILLGLGEIANRGLAVAVAWHVVLGLALMGLARGWRPAQRTAETLIAVPLVSVAVFALAFGNPFNAAMFAAGALALMVLARTSEPLPVSPGPSWAFGAGLAMIAFGWVYPHFLLAHPAMYLVAAPVGLIPCPTLSVAIGFALLAGGRRTRAWHFTLAALGLFYGVFGVLRLGVWLDIGLVAGAAALGATVMHAARGSGSSGRSGTPSRTI